MEHTNIRAWTDLNPGSRFRNAAPNVIIRASEISTGEYDGAEGDDFRPGVVRCAAYFDPEETSPKYWYVELVLYKHPIGAGSISLHSAGSSLCRGRFLGEDGSFTVSKNPAKDIAGGMLSHYCDTTSFISNGGSNQPTWATTLNEGDYIWLVRSGRYEALCDGAGVVTAGSNIVVDNSDGGSPDGTVQNSVTTIATLQQVEENVMYSGRCIGYANEAQSGAYADLTIDLGIRVVAPTP